jgi:hypothetical protein
MAERSQFDMSKMSTASKILAGAGLLYLIDLFFAWQKVCINLGVLGNHCGKQIGWHGWGFLAGIIVIIILVMEALLLAGVQVNIGSTQMKMMTEAGLAGALLLFTVLKFFVDNEFRKWPAFVGLILALVIAYGGYMRWQEASVATPPPAPPAGGGGFAP